MDLGLKGKVAIVTGAGSQIGFGRAIAMTLAKEGCNIIATDINLPGAKQTVADVESLGRKAMAIKVDVTNRDEVNEMVKAALKKFKKIDILVNNAGSTNKPTPFADMPEAWADLDIEINLKGVMNCTKAVINQMRERKYGKIINISSAAGKMGMPDTTVYTAAKAGVIGFTRGLAAEMAPLGINVNSVAPGGADTGFNRHSQVPDEAVKGFANMIPIRRLTEPHDIANMVSFLASDAASDIVGQTISVDGGLTMI
jgi:NAD(P)-dependent dehydrogenase (short-subunit alcohol dehydrogenase family)